jgi:hypothetical protein
MRFHQVAANGNWYRLANDADEFPVKKLTN